MKTVAFIGIRSWMVSMAILISFLVPISSWASVEVDGIYYDLNTSAKTAAVTSGNEKYSGNIYIPESFEYKGSNYSVTSIGNTAFLDCNAMTTVSLPNSVRTIGYSAFERCSGLVDINLGSGLNSIGYEAFQNCKSLTTVVLPESLISLGEHAFNGCSSLSWVNIPSGVSSLGNGIFSGCASDIIIVVERVTPPSVSNDTFSGVDLSSSTLYVPEGCQSAYFNANYWMAFQNIVERIVLSSGSCGGPSYAIYADGTIVISGSGRMRQYARQRPLFLEAGHRADRVIIKDGVTSVGIYAFHTFGIDYISISNTVTEIEPHALSGNNLKYLIIPNSVKEIGGGALINGGYNSLYIPKNVHSIYSWYEEEFPCGPLSGCENLNTIIVDEANIYYDSRENCNAIIETSTNALIAGCKNTLIPYSVTSIDDYAFEGCTGLTSIEIPNSVASIGDWAFSGCTGLTSIALSNSVTSIGPDAFDGCTGLTSITVASGNTMYDSRDNCNAIIESSTNTLLFGCQNTIIPNSVTSIGYEAFEGCTGLTSIEIPNSVTSIGRFAFLGCTGLTSIKIPNSVTSIGQQAFDGCTGLTSIEIPNSVTSIGGSAFSDCTGLTSITVGWETPLAISLSHFYNVDKTECILCVPYGTKSAYESAEVWGDFENIKEYFNADGLDILATGECGADGDNVTYTIYSDMTMVISGTGEMQDYNNEAHINDDYYQSIHKVIIEDGVTNIGYLVFSGCTGLTSIEIPNSVTSIGGYAFDGCTGLTSIEIPNSVTSFGGSVFQDCTGLTSIEIPNSVTSLGGADFWGCTSLASVVLSNGLRFIEMHTFQNCTSLTSIEIPNSVTVLGDCAFGSCTSLTTIELPSSVKTIGSETFGGCTSLTSIEIPNSVTSIGDAFYRCTGLTSITVGWETPLSLPYYSSVFNHFDKTACTLYVPFGTKSAYESAAGWSDFQNIVELDTDLSALSNAIYVNQTEGRIGGTIDIPVNIKSSYPVRGFQFAMELPEGAIINSWALSTDRLPSGATTSDKIAAQNITGNKITVACSLNYGTAAFTGNDGVVATINVTFPDTMEPGSYPIYLTACDVNDASGKDEDLSDVKATLILEDYLPGDANGDGKVRIGDATTILNYIVGSVSDNFKEKAADANGDGKIRIGDATTILNIIVNQ